MESLIPTNEYREVEGRIYANPQVGLDETNAFIENLRATQGQNNAQIAQQTQRLGTDVPTNLGGLTAPSGDTGLSYFTSRYQVPQTNSAVANLRAAAQAQALNEVLANEQAIWKNRYQNAYRNYQKRQHDKANIPATPANPTTTGGVDYEDTSDPSKTVGRVEPSYSPMGSGDFEYRSNDSIFNNSALNPNTGLTPSNTLTPNGNVDIQRDKFGNITSLTYNGKTFTGDAAKQRYQWLQSTGIIGGRK